MAADSKSVTVPVQLATMALLKASTLQQHLAVEQLMPFFEDHFSREAYIETLVTFLGFYGPLECSLSMVPGWESIGIDLGKRRRAHLLRADLLALGLSPKKIIQMPTADILPGTKNVYEALGCLYVLEGSTLGGQLIAREVNRRFGIEHNSGTSFFEGHGRDVGPMWSEFCMALNAFVDSPRKQKMVIAAAVETFATFEVWLRRRRHA